MPGVRAFSAASASHDALETDVGASASSALRRIADSIDDLRLRLGEAEQQLHRNRHSEDGIDRAAVAGVLAAKIRAAESKLTELTLVFGQAEASIVNVETILRRKGSPLPAQAG